jgi:8-oxo-dGTP diphosphatase
MRSVRVVAAVIRGPGGFLISRRLAGAERGGQWEFPGGKVEPGEAEPEALRREIREELGCEVEVGPFLARHRHRYPDLEVELAFYACRLPAGAEPRPHGVASLAWAPPGTLASYDFCEADRPVLPALEAAGRSLDPRP